MAVRTTSWTWGFPCRDVKWKWLLRSVLTYLWSLSTFHHSTACFSLKEEKMHVYSATWLLPSRRTLHCPRSMSSCLSRSLSWSTQRERERERERERAPLISSRDTSGQEGLPWCGFQLQTFHVAGLLFYFHKFFAWTFVSSWILLFLCFKNWKKIFFYFKLILFLYFKIIFIQ